MNFFKKLFSKTDEDSKAEKPEIVQENKNHITESVGSKIEEIKARHNNGEDISLEQIKVELSKTLMDSIRTNGFPPASPEAIKESEERNRREDALHNELREIIKNSNLLIKSYRKDKKQFDEIYIAATIRLFVYDCAIRLRTVPISSSIWGTRDLCYSGDYSPFKYNVINFKKLIPENLRVDLFHVVEDEIYKFSFIELLELLEIPKNKEGQYLLYSNYETFFNPKLPIPIFEDSKKAESLSQDPSQISRWDYMMLTREFNLRPFKLHGVIEERISRWVSFLFEPTL